MGTKVKVALAVLRARGAVLGAVAGLCVAGGISYGVFARDRYEAAATLLVEPGGPESSAITGASHGPDLGLLKSERVAQRVIENERLAEDPALHELYLASIDAGKPPMETLAKAIASDVDAPAGGEGSVVRLTVTAVDPNLAARVANAYAQAWGEILLEVRSASIRNGIERAHQELVALRARLGAAKASTSDEGALVAGDAQADAQFAQLTQIASPLVRQADAGAGVDGEDAHAETLPAVRRDGRTDAVSAAEEIRLAQRSLERAEERLTRLAADSVGTPFPVHLLLSARAPELSSKPGVGACAGAGLLAGLLLGGLAVLLAERLDRRVRRSADVARGLGVVVLGVLPSATAPMGAQQGAARSLHWQRATGTM